MKITKTCLALGLVTILSACSAYMAAVGDEEPNLSNVRRGASRGEIEMALGQPKSFSTVNGGEQAAYEYTIGNEPSAGRAVGHAVLDVLTLGWWELIGTPVEAFNQGDKVRVNVTYDTAGTATEINSSR